MQHQITGSDGRPMLLDVTFGSAPHPQKVIVFCHGFKGFKDWGHFPQVATYFAGQGFVFVKFNFSHNGTTVKTPTLFSDPEAFGRNNLSREMEDLGLVTDWVTSELPNIIPSNVELDAQSVGLMGHSRGGGIAILHAAEDKRIGALATWAAVSDFGSRVAAFDLQKLQKDGMVHVMNSRTGEQLPLYKQFLEDYLENSERFRIDVAASGLKIPVMFVHGTADESVPYSEMEALSRCCRHAQTLAIQGADHTFGASHPLRGNKWPGDTGQVVQKTVAFFEKCMVGAKA